MIDQNNPTPRPHYAIQAIHPLANTEHIKRKILDIPYANQSPAQKLDIYLPDDIPESINRSLYLSTVELLWAATNQICR